MRLIRIFKRKAAADNDFVDQEENFLLDSADAMRIAMANPGNGREGEGMVSIHADYPCILLRSIGKGFSVFHRESRFGGGIPAWLHRTGNIKNSGRIVFSQLRT